MAADKKKAAEDLILDAADMDIVMEPAAERQIVEVLEKEPGADAAFRRVFKILEDARQGWLSGKYATMDDAMEALTGKRPVMGPDGIPVIHLDEEDTHADEKKN